MNKIERNILIYELYKTGSSYAQIARTVKLSRQRISQIIEEMEKPKLGRSYPVVRKEALIRDNHQCRMCQKKKNLQVHHMDKNRQNNALRNLKTLCPKCLKQVHKIYTKEFIKKLQELDQRIAYRFPCIFLKSML